MMEQAAAAEANGDGKVADMQAAVAARTKALQSKMIAATFGEIVSVLMRSPNHKHCSLMDLESLVVPALLNNQYSLAEARSKEGGFTGPIALALWARVSEEVDQKLSDNLDPPIRLRPDEWRSGDILWLIDAVGAPQAVNALIKRLGTTAFQGKPFKVRTMDKDGNRSVQTIEPDAGGNGKATDEDEAEASGEQRANS